MGWLPAALGFGSKVAEAVTEGEDLAKLHNATVAGEDKVIAVDNAASAQVNADVAKAAVDTTDSAALNSLRDGRA